MRLAQALTQPSTPAGNSHKRTRATSLTTTNHHSSTVCLCNRWQAEHQHSKLCRKGSSNLAIARGKATQA